MWSNLLRLIKLSLLVLLALVISSCGFIYGEDGLIKSQKYEYINARQSKPLELPPSLSHKDKADYTLLPNIGEQGKKGIIGKSLEQAAPTQLLAVLENTRVDRKSTVPAVLIIDDLEFIWQTATQFIENHNVRTSIQDQQSRTIISNWLAIEEGGIWLGLDGNVEPEYIRAKYKILIEKGVIKGEHKLTVERIASQVRTDDDEQWSDKRVSWRESADMMNLLLSYYDTRLRIQEARHQQQIMAGFKVDLGQDAEGNPTLLTFAKEKLVWEKIPKVMRELGFTIIDKDTRQKTYFMEYHPPEEGFFASLFDSKDILLPLEEGSFQITVGESGQQRSITIKNAQGTGIETELLVKLYPDLSRLFGDRR